MSGIDFDIEYLIYPHLCEKNKLCIGLRSVELNADCCAKLTIPDEIIKEILYTLDRAAFDLVNSEKNNNLIKPERVDCNPCVVSDGKCKKCGGLYN